jgi:hypothetical protein
MRCSVSASRGLVSCLSPLAVLDAPVAPRLTVASAPAAIDAPLISVPVAFGDRDTGVPNERSPFGTARSRRFEPVTGGDREAAAERAASTVLICGAAIAFGVQALLDGFELM